MSADHATQLVAMMNNHVWLRAIESKEVCRYTLARSDGQQVQD
jgi:hypothetical protein